MLNSWLNQFGMKRLIIVFGLFFTLSYANCQEIDDLLSSVNLDSLISSVRFLSGEDSVFIAGTMTMIDERSSNDGRNLAAQYIRQKLLGYNLSVSEQKYSETGTNIIGYQTGTLYPDSIYLICAHYDSKTFFAADDNASGVAAVLESARILSEYDFNYTIKYALWDEEELGLIGSRYFADSASNYNLNILGILNLDMLGYDGDNDLLFDIHVNENKKTQLLKDELLNVINSYDFSIIPKVQNPGATNSDHASFWENDFGAILLIEGYYSDDFNPFIHTVDDRINVFSLAYFKEMSKLAVGTLATLAKSGPGISAVNQQSLVLNLYPNPTTQYFKINNHSPSVNKISIYSIDGRLLKVVDNYNSGNFIDVSSLINGTYVVIIESDQQVLNRMLIKE